MLSNVDTGEVKDPCAFNKLLTISVPHILEKIFLSLDYKSFKICKEVSNSWKDLLTSESFKTLGKSVFREDIERELHEHSYNGNLMAVKSILSSGMADVRCTWGHYDEDPVPLPPSWEKR